ncbi:AarF/UbiB family protein [Dethiothermospora halolimnae]|uniref:AarF/UbiB family protein n=1 Tax=Dethiothermospora halolimnae TaxID=3114390 RepID=UPI003CCBE27C
MNIISFFGLIREIFKKGKPDLEKIEEKGLLAVKIGQVFALRIDFLSPEKCTYLSKLYQDNSFLPKEDYEVLIKRYTGPYWRDRFLSIEEKPLASASIAQVHRGKLHTGEDIVIKLVKKDFVSDFKQDVNKVTSLFKFITFFYPKLRRVANPVELLKMIKDDTLSELDLNNEIKNQNILKKIYNNNKAKFDLSDLKFPKAYKNLSNERVLVTEEIKGETFEKLLQRNELPYEQLLKLFHIHGFYMFVIGTFHGDLHPGNIMLKDDKIYFIDCGAIGQVSKNLRVGLFRFMKHLSYYEFESCAKSLNDMSDVKLKKDDFKKFQKDFLKLYKDFPNKTVSEVSLTKQMMATIKLGVNHGMDFNKNIFSIIKSLMYLDGMVIRCNPDAVLMKDMRANVEELEKTID